MEFRPRPGYVFRLAKFLYSEGKMNMGSMTEYDVSGGGGGFFGGTLGAVLVGALLPNLFGWNNRRGFDGEGGGSIEGRIYRDIELADLRKEVSDGKCCNIRDMLGQTNFLQAENFKLQGEILNNRFEAEKCCCATQKEILAMGLNGQIGDLKTKAEVDAKLCALAVGQEKILGKIEESRLIDTITDLKRENANLRERDEKTFTAGLAAKVGNLTIQLGDALKAFNGTTFPWNIPAGTFGY